MGTENGKQRTETAMKMSDKEIALSYSRFFESEARECQLKHKQLPDLERVTIQKDGPIKYETGSGYSND